jgi:arylsulfatase A-like enzyme
VNGVDLTGTLALCDGTTNSLPLSKVGDYTTCEPSVMAYDDVKVQAVINEIDGKTSDGTKAAPVPTILGLNFQEVSVGQKLPVGGYADASGTPSALLAGAIAHVDASLGRIVSELEAKHLSESTLVIVSAKHGQSPIDRSALAMEPGGRGNATVTDPLVFVNAADPDVGQVFAPFVNPNDGSSPLVRGHLMADDVGVLWLQDQSPANVANVVAELTDPAHATAIFADTLPPGTIFSSNITSGVELAAIYGDPQSRDATAAARAPNVLIQPNHGVIYSGSTKKISEHGGGTLDDTGVALIVSNPRIHARVIADHVWTKQVAPTILSALGLDPEALEAVRKERTRVLPGLGY